MNQMKAKKLHNDGSQLKKLFKLRSFSNQNSDP